MHGGRELVREEGYVLEFDRSKDFSRTNSTTDDAKRGSGEKVASTNAKGNVVEIGTNRNVKNTAENASGGGRSTKSEGSKN